MKNMSQDRSLLEKRGALIIRQLCISLDPERTYRLLAEVLEKEEVYNDFLKDVYHRVEY